MNLLKIAQTFTTEDQALDYLVASRWPDGVRCLACDHDTVYRIDTHGRRKATRQTQNLLPRPESLTPFPLLAA